MTEPNSPATKLRALSRGTTALARRFLQIALPFGFLISLASTAARAQCTAVPGVNVINWTDPLSDAWSVASDWNLDCVPNNGTPPGAAYDVRIINGGRSCGGRCGFFFRRALFFFSAPGKRQDRHNSKADVNLLHMILSLHSFYESRQKGSYLRRLTCSVPLKFGLSAAGARPSAGTQTAQFLGSELEHIAYQ